MVRLAVCQFHKAYEKNNVRHKKSRCCYRLEVHDNLCASVVSGLMSSDHLTSFLVKMSILQVVMWAHHFVNLAGNLSNKP